MVSMLRSWIKLFTKRNFIQNTTIQKYADVLIVEGMDERAAANKTVVDAIINIAKLTKDESLLTILDNIITDKDSDSRLAGTFRTDIADALQYG